MKSLNKITLGVLSLALLIPVLQVNAMDIGEVSPASPVLMEDSFPSTPWYSSWFNTAKNGASSAWKRTCDLTTNARALASSTPEMASNAWGKTVELTGQAGSAVATAPSKTWEKTKDAYNWAKKNKVKTAVTTGSIIGAGVAGYALYKYFSAKEDLPVYGPKTKSEAIKQGLELQALKAEKLKVYGKLNATIKKNSPELYEQLKQTTLNAAWNNSSAYEVDAELFATFNEEQKALYAQFVELSEKIASL